MKRKIVSMLLVILLTLGPSAALAGKSIGDGTGDIQDTVLFNVLDFKFHHYQYGIGYGNCPVYTAPSLDAYRCANGRASVDTNEDMWIGGFDLNGWLLVRYETSNGGVRVGYIPPSYVKGFKTTIDRLQFNFVPQVAISSIMVTDNPMNPNSAFAVLSRGETYYILGKYTYYGNWWYIECEVNGQVARGFINRDTTAVDPGDGNYTTDLGEPTLSPYGGSKIGEVRVMGEAKMVRQNAGQDYAMVARVSYPETYPVYDAKPASNGKTWYYIFVDGVWGWISESVVQFTPN